MKRGQHYQRKRPHPPMQPIWSGDEPCRTAPDVFHPEITDSRAAEIARWLCKRCPSQVPCLEWAMQDPQLEGIHAGTSRRQRASMRANK